MLNKGLKKIASLTDLGGQQLHDLRA